MQESEISCSLATASGNCHGREELWPEHSEQRLHEWQQDGTFIIGESAAIVTYLSRTYSTPDNSLVPDNPAEFARWLEWCFFITSELDSKSLYVMRRHGTNQGLAHIYGAAPEVVEKAGEYFRDRLRHVDVSLRDGRHYLMGDRFTSADILFDHLPGVGHRAWRRSLRQRVALSRASNLTASLYEKRRSHTAAI
jgi:glutathione S-transferase